MITKRELDDATTCVTFAVTDDRPVSVVGDFNGWEPFAHPLVEGSDGLRSADVVVLSGTVLRFRYLADGGEYYDDPDADEIEPNGLGGTDGVVHTLAKPTDG